MSSFIKHEFWQLVMKYNKEILAEIDTGVIAKRFIPKNQFFMISKTNLDQA
jgi:hypothetical protein